MNSQSKVEVVAVEVAMEVGAVEAVEVEMEVEEMEEAAVEAAEVEMEVAEEGMEVVAEEMVEAVVATEEEVEEMDQVTKEVEVMFAEQNLFKNVKQSPELPADKFPHKAAPKYLREAAIRWK